VRELDPAIERAIFRCLERDPARRPASALAVAAALPAQAQPAKGEPYRIGIILPMTGPTADYGADFNRGAVLAEEEINASGGIKGRPIKLVLGDSKNQPKDGVAEFKRMVEIE
jgi:branched-chain amino acid transport system substrate-binding protein